MYSRTVRPWFGFGVLIAVLLAACGSESEADITDTQRSEQEDAQDSVDACPAPIASLDQCFQGVLTAECGAAGAPVLGCEPNGASSRCFWFLGACMPPGFVPSSCSTEDFCCSDAFPEPLTTELLAPLRLLGLGTSPWSPERAMTLSVTEHSGLQRDTSFSPQVLCNGAFEVEDQTTPCGDAVLSVSNPGTLVLTFGPAEGVFSGWRLLLELDPRSATGRACQVPFRDAELLTCQVEAEPKCASSGSIVIDRWPSNAAEAAQVHGELEARFGEVELQAQF
ncbi:MAG: hypothetical protein RBU37_23475 [Myxococcota bacterium]|jgi:hypothetical protein|nr:hypothetical protein [Myxococcota bacterium]